MKNRLVAFGAVMTSVSLAGADPVLDNSTASMTTNLMGAASAGQDVWPTHRQRGVNLDGSLRPGAGSTFGWWLAAAGELSEPWNGRAAIAGVRLDTGTAALTEVDLALPSAGPRWVVGRSFNSVQVDGTPSHRDSNGYQGYNWFQSSQPEIKYYDQGTANGDSGDAVYIIYGADRYIEAKWVSTSVNDANTRKDEFKAVNGAAGMIQKVEDKNPGTSPDLWTYTDQFGNSVVFFGGNTSGGAADWQFWKMTDPAGNAVYVGDSSLATTAVSSGYTSKRIQKVSDSP